MLVHLSAILGILVAAFLWINQFPDYRADRESGKRNLVVRLGLNRAAFVYVVIVGSAYAWLGLLMASDTGSSSLLPGIAGVFPALYSAWQLLCYDGQVQRLVPAQAAALASFILMSTGCGAGYLLLP